MLARTALARSAPVARSRRCNSAGPGKPAPGHQAINQDRKNSGIIVGTVALGALGLFYFLQKRGEKDAKWNEQKAAQDKATRAQRQQADVNAEHKATKEGVVSME